MTIMYAYLQNKVHSVITTVHEFKTKLKYAGDKKELYPNCVMNRNLCIKIHIVQSPERRTNSPTAR